MQKFRESQEKIKKLSDLTFPRRFIQIVHEPDLAEDEQARAHTNTAFYLKEYRGPLSHDLRRSQNIKGLPDRIKNKRITGSRGGSREACYRDGTGSQKRNSVYQDINLNRNIDMFRNESNDTIEDPRM